ncbi:hypothetical protein ACLOJK_034482 [Asimina triloba]
MVVSASKIADAVSRSAVELITSRERRAAEAVVPDNDNGSGDNSLVRQHVPAGHADDHRKIASEDKFVKSFDGMERLDDLDYLLNLCGDLEQSLRCFSVEWYMHASKARFLGLQQEASQLIASMEEDECQQHFALEAENRLVKEPDTKVVILSATKARVAKIDVELPSYRKVVEELEAIMIRDSSCL